MEKMLQATTTQSSSIRNHFGTDFSLHVPPPEEGEIAAAEKVTDRLFQRARSSLELAGKRSAAIGKVLTDWRASLDEQVGSDIRRRLVDYLQKQRTTNFGLENYRPGEVAPDRVATAKKKARERSLELLDEANVDRDALQKIHARAQEQFLRSLGPPDARARQLEVVRDEEVPTAIREGRTNPWFVKIPPYDGWYRNVGAQTGGGGSFTSLKDNIEILHGLQYPGPYISGQFGYYSRYENFDVSGFDWMTLSAVTEVGFWYKPPQPGERQVWVKIRCKKARADVYLDDEYGSSSSGTNMFSRLYLEVVQVPGLEGQTGDWHISVPGSPESTWFHLDWIVPGTVLWLPFDANFPPDWVYVGIGADDYRSTLVNNVSTNQAMDSRYLVEQVWIQQ